MIVKRNLKWNLILFYTWKNLLFYIFVAVVVYWVDHETHLSFNVPFDAITAFSTALAIFLGFKNNNAYDRWWEACQWWGLLVSESRTWARELIIFINSPKKEDHEEIIREFNLKEATLLSHEKLDLQQHDLLDLIFSGNLK